MMGHLPLCLFRALVQSLRTGRIEYCESKYIYLKERKKENEQVKRMYVMRKSQRWVLSVCDHLLARVSQYLPQCE